MLALSVAYPQIPLAPPTLPDPNSMLTPGIHIEMWANVPVNGSDHYIRLPAQVGSNPPESFTGFSVVRAIDPNDYCLIRALDKDDELCANPDTFALDKCGTQMFSKPAQIIPDDSTADLAQMGLVIQARKVTSPDVHFNVYDSTVVGRAPSPLLALVQFNPDYANDPRRTRTADATSAGDVAQAQTRTDICRNYKGVTDEDKEGKAGFYVGNPRQYTKPLSGTLFGFFSFQTCTTATSTCPIATPDLPVQNFSGITFSVPMSLDGIQGLVATLETSQNPAGPNLGLTAFTSSLKPDCTGGTGPQPAAVSGRGVVRFLMCANTNPMFSPPFLTLVGTTDVITNLDSEIN